MKKHLLAVLVAAGVLSAATSHATPISWSSGDVFLGFEDATANKNLIIDLGAGSSLSSFTSINVGNDLTTVFGSGWTNNSNLYYGIFGINSTKTLVWASTLSGANAFGAKSTGALATTLAHYNALAANYTQDISNGQGLTVGVEMFPGTGNDTAFGTWTGNNPRAQSGTAFAVYNQSLEGNVSSGDTLDVYQTGNLVGSSSKLFAAVNGNQIQITSAGVVQVVPEPSTYALCGLGVIVLALAGRRKLAKNKIS